MKYTNVPAFKRQIEAAYQKEMPRVYLILAESAFERARLLDYVLCYLPHPNAYSVFRYAGEEADAAKIISALSSPSLFGGRPLLILDDAAALAKDTVRRLSEFIKEPFGGYLVMGASAKGALLPLLREVESCGMLLDLLAEKPWEKEKRLADFLQAECAKACKTLEKQASSRLLEFAGLDMSALFREINKLIAFVGERAVITAEDVLAVCYRSHQNTIWQLAEELVWNRNLIIDERWRLLFFMGWWRLCAISCSWA